MPKLGCDLGGSISCFSNCDRLSSDKCLEGDKRAHDVIGVGGRGPTTSQFRSLIMSRDL